jgi:predicted Fe-Mo cluster-binding NifX family protein
MNKIAVSCEEPSLDSAVDPRFGRAAGFLIVNPENLEFEFVDNGASQAMPQGAGIQAAELIANSGAKVVLTGFVGPKAFMALSSAGVKVGQDLENVTVRQALERLKTGQVKFAEQPNKGGHWS